MEPADDVELGDLVAPLLGGMPVDLVVTHLPGMLLTGQCRKAAEFAVVGVDTDVGGV
jgi:hypothetical protein